MFSGIIKKMGRIKKIESKNGKVYFTISVKNFLYDINIGDSIDCDGVCLTVIEKSKDNFKTELMPETLRLTKFQNSKVGDLINLEKSLKIGQRINGHFVVGHIDGIGIVKKIIIDKNNYKEIIIKAPNKLVKFLAYKGSVCINGVSLTISGVERNLFKVSLITHTLKITNLSKLKIGDKVNIEVDILSRYLDKLYCQSD